MAGEVAGAGVVGRIWGLSGRDRERDRRGELLLLQNVCRSHRDRPDGQAGDQRRDDYQDLFRTHVTPSEDGRVPPLYAGLVEMLTSPEITAAPRRGCGCPRPRRVGGACRPSAAW